MGGVGAKGVPKELRCLLPRSLQFLGPVQVQVARGRQTEWLGASSPVWQVFPEAQAGLCSVSPCSVSAADPSPGVPRASCLLWYQVEVKNVGSGTSRSGACTPIPSHLSVALDELLYVSGPQFPHL